MHCSDNCYPPRCLARRIFEYKNLPSDREVFWKNLLIIYTQSSFFALVFAVSVLFDDVSLDVVLVSESGFDVVRLPDGERLSVA